MEENINLQSLVESFKDAVNRKDVDKVLTMFTEDAEFELVGVSKYCGKEQIKNQFEYDAGVNGELKFTAFRSEENTVYCQCTERNDRLAAPVGKPGQPEFRLRHAHAHAAAYRAARRAF